MPGGRQTVIVSATLKQETLDAYSYLAPNLKHIIATYDKPVSNAAAAKTTTRRTKTTASARRKERLRGGATSANAGCRQSSTAYHALFCRIRASTQG